MDGRGNLPCPRSGNLAADPVFFSDPTNALGRQAVSAVRSRGSSLILATPCSRQVGRKPALRRVRCGAGAGSRATPRIALLPGVLAPAAAPKRLRQGNFKWRPQSQGMGGGRPGEAAEELGKRGTGRAAGCWVPAATLSARTARTHARLTRTAHTHTPARAHQHARPASRSRPQATGESQKRAFTRGSPNGKVGDIVPSLQLKEYSSPFCHHPAPRPVSSLHF